MPPISAADPTPPGEAGFTILEVLMAFAIIAALMGSLLTLYTATGRTAARAEAGAIAIEAARSALERIGPEYALEERVLVLTDGPVQVSLSVARASGPPGLFDVTAVARVAGTERTLRTLRASRSGP